MKLKIESARPPFRKALRRLNWNELVSRGDFVKDVHRGLELWDGPTGFRADAFMNPIYRREEIRLTLNKK